MDSSKVFDCITHDLLIAKLHAYGLSFNTVTFLSSYLKDREKNVRINNIFSKFQNILSVVPQGSMLGPILFNIILHDFFLCIKKSNLHNFVDDYTITATCNTLTGLADKFQAIIFKKKESEAKYKLTIDNNDCEFTKFVKLLGIKLINRYQICVPKVQCNKMLYVDSRSIWENLKNLQL